MISRSHIESRASRSFRVPAAAGRLLAHPLFILLGALASLGLAGCAGPTAAPGEYDARSELASEMALLAMDREALFTIAPADDGTRLKALSTGFWQSKLDTAAPSDDAVRELERRRRALDLLDCRELDFGVMSFATVFDGQRHVEAYVVHVATMDDVLARHPTFFAPFALTPGTSVGEVLATVERMPRLDRFRAYGLLFGYPQYAVDFFVEAAGDEVPAGEPGATRPIVPRDFISIPVYESEANRFVWAAPKGHAGHPDDDRTRERARAILAHYRSLRGEPPTDGILLLRKVQKTPTR